MQRKKEIYLSKVKTSSKCFVIHWLGGCCGCSAESEVEFQEHTDFFDEMCQDAYGIPILSR